jgi:O-antigen/teichoic acid export membrane protein
MPKHLVAGLLILSFASLLVFAYFWFNAPPALIETKGAEDSATVQYVSLATAVVSLLTAMVGLLNTRRRAGGGES